MLLNSYKYSNKISNKSSTIDEILSEVDSLYSEKDAYAIAFTGHGTPLQEGKSKLDAMKKKFAGNKETKNAGVIDILHSSTIIDKLEISSRKLISDLFLKANNSKDRLSKLKNSRILSLKKRHESTGSIIGWLIFGFILGFVLVVGQWFTGWVLGNERSIATSVFILLVSTLLGACGFLLDSPDDVEEKADEEVSLKKIKNDLNTLEPYHNRISRMNEKYC